MCRTTHQHRAFRTIPRTTALTNRNHRFDLASQTCTQPQLLRRSAVGERAPTGSPPPCVWVSSALLVVVFACRVVVAALCSCSCCGSCSCCHVVVVCSHVVLSCCARGRGGWLVSCSCCLCGRVWLRGGGLAVVVWCGCACVCGTLTACRLCVRVLVGAWCWALRLAYTASGGGVREARGVVAWWVVAVCAGCGCVLWGTCVATRVHVACSCWWGPLSAGSYSPLSGPPAVPGARPCCWCPCPCGGVKGCGPDRYPCRGGGRCGAGWCASVG